MRFIILNEIFFLISITFQSTKLWIIYQKREMKSVNLIFVQLAIEIHLLRKIMILNHYLLKNAVRKHCNIIFQIHIKKTYNNVGKKYYEWKTYHW